MTAVLAILVQSAQTVAMLETFAFGACAVLVLLATDLAVRRLAHRPDERASGARMLQAARVLSLFLIARTLATACRTGDLGADVAWAAVFGLCGLVAFELALVAGMRLLQNGGAAAEVAGERCDVPAPEWAARATWRHLFATLPMLDFASVRSDAVYVVPGGDRDAFSLRELQGDDYDYLVPIG